MKVEFDIPIREGENPTITARDLSEALDVKVELAHITMTGARFVAALPPGIDENTFYESVESFRRED